VSVRARWTVRIAIVAFGVLIGGVSVVDAAMQASGLSSAPAGPARRAVLASVIGGLLKGLGLGGVFFCQAAEFRDWSSWSRPLRPLPGAGSGFRSARRAARQIDGVEPYGPDEVARLRQLAEHRVSLRRSTLAGRLAVVSLVVFFVGVVLSPPSLEPVTGPVLGQVLRVLAIIMIVFLVAACVVSWRATTDKKAEAFLERTAPPAPDAAATPRPDQGRSEASP